ncbi:MAG: Gfo/Idh/MocA family oxidoreductase [Odoribacteraceae bacterium]|jgi:glycerol-3-phosphate cytidylyltransferase|nr:Gfo/Idh/MocA family oxidoreductase [Odoribacteraceae bacterium]
MKKVITYGTFDLLHHGHVSLLRRARALGDYLIVGVTSENFDKERGKLNVRRSLPERVADVLATGLADEIIVEEYEGQKIDDIQRRGVDIFAIGSDWADKFNYLREYCRVVYLERTKDISSTMIRDATRRAISLGIIGNGRVADRFVPESKYVSGVDVTGVYNPREESARSFRDRHELRFATGDLDHFFSLVEAVYIASPHHTHASYTRAALLAGKHVLCEKPLVLTAAEAVELHDLAAARRLVLLEALKSAYCPGFKRLVNLVKSGAIGQVKDISASFTKLVEGRPRELTDRQAGGSITELGSYVFLPAIKLLGVEHGRVTFHSWRDGEGVDLFTRGLVEYPSATASFKVGLGVKTEGNLVISGTKGYAYVPAPWWKTEFFELRRENPGDVKKYFYKFDGDGLRYELDEFVRLVNDGERRHSYMFSPAESIATARLIESFREGKNTTQIH